MAKPKILLVTTDRECAKETMVTLAGKFDVTHLDNGEKALALLGQRQPLHGASFWPRPSGNEWARTTDSGI